MKWLPGKPPLPVLDLLQTEKRLQEQERLRMIQEYKQSIDRVTARTEVIRACLALERVFPDLTRLEVFDAVGTAYCLAPSHVKTIFHETMKEPEAKGA